MKIRVPQAWRTPFYFFATMCALQFFVVLFVYPETKGATLEQLQQRMEGA